TAGRATQGRRTDDHPRRAGRESRTGTAPQGGKPVGKTSHAAGALRADDRRSAAQIRRPKADLRKITISMPRRTDIHSVLIIGAGPILIGQACEFDYSGTQACKALKEEGYRVVLVNSNPATIMTDPEFADRTYIDPITPETVEKIIVRELDEMKRMGVPVSGSAGVSPASDRKS